MATINLLPPLDLRSPKSDVTSFKPSNKALVGKEKIKGLSDIKSTNGGSFKLKLKGSQDSHESLKDEIDPASYRNSTFHNVCTSVLNEGFHEAFTELFTLVEKQRHDHIDAGPAAILLSPLIDDNEEKLQYLVSRLKEAETARRKEELDVVYMCQKDLALHFEDTADHWLADHFHLCCLETGCAITGDNRRKEGEAHLHVGLAYENRGEFEDSIKHLCEFYELTRLNKWHTDSGERLHPIACEHLRRVHTKMAEEQESMDSTIEHLVRAHQLAKESGDTYQEGVANYRLGCAYEKIEDYGKAIQSHKGHLERCRYHGDQVGVSKAYEALSRCHEMQEDIESAVKFLELYVGVAEGIVAKETVAKAYCSAGIMFNFLRDYKKAVDYFSKSYSTCKAIGDKQTMESARVHCGIAQTHHKLALFTKKIEENSDSEMRHLIEWKGRRKLSQSEAAKAKEGERRPCKKSGRQSIQTSTDIISENNDS